MPFPGGAFKPVPILARRLSPCFGGQRQRGLFRQKEGIIALHHFAFLRISYLQSLWIWLFFRQLPARSRTSYEA
jgi:hypothetical protein